MKNVPSRPRPRSLPVVVLTAIISVFTAVGRPFRWGRLPTYQQIAVGIGAGIVVIGLAVLLMGVRWDSSIPTSGPRRAAADGTPTAKPGTGTRTPTASEISPSTDGSTPPPVLGAPTGGAPTPSAPGGSGRAGSGGRAEPLRARFSKVAGSESLTRYRATVTVTNPGQVAASSWTVAITLPRETLTLSDVEGATVSRNGATWTVVPAASVGTVAAGGSVSVSFQVNGAAVFDATPTACTINGQACTGLG
ncbi:cellulose binding domain-containing protein [Virgisporangium aurantiacum]|uniref:CBM2 domain-containing protein n=1 Tax=Virgisporangium aurantiacum TaxID=175570 RepID=A0A8J3ZF17_9ACTN|nr:cellulose binding domain-containing protein [Virgisporangium aurantiacum]GIJ60440.1 hypothetical protein Vau01_079560 [Virgisporangium aurantiacum]